MEQNIIDLEVLPEGAKVTITVDTHLYKRLQQVALEGLPFKDLDHFKKCLDLIKQDKSQDDPISYHLHSILYLVQLIEAAAKEQGLTHLRKFDLKEKKMVESE